MSDVNDMAVFLRVAMHGSFTAAGRELRLTPSAVTKRIGKLEARLDVRLFNRSTRRLQLTEAGSVYLDHCERILASIEQAEAMVASGRSEPRGLLKVTAPTLFGRLHVASWVAEFSERHPNVNVHLQLTDRIVNLLAEGIDIAIRNASLQDSAEIAKKIASDRRLICATPDYFERHGRPRTIEDLRHHQCLLLRFPGTRQYRWQLNGPNGTTSVPVKGVIDSNSGEVLYRWLLEGRGLSLRSTAEVSEDLRSGRLMAAMTEFMPRNTGYYAVYPHREWLPSKVRSFLDFLTETVGKVPEWDTHLPS